MMRRALTASIAAMFAGTAAAAAGLGGCAPSRDPGTVTYASGSDLESANPLVTIHPLSRQVQRHAIFVTLARFDESLAPAPYAAREWSWSPDRRRLTMRITTELRWSDGTRTTASDAAWTMRAARDPASGYYRAAELTSIDTVVAPDDSTLEIRFSAPVAAFPGILCELPILPEHVLRDVPLSGMRRSAFATAPVTNGPFRFVSRTPGQRWIFARNPDFPPSLGGPPHVERLVIAVVDEPTTKFAGLVSGELDVAGISPTMAPLASRDPALTVLDYPVLFSYALVFNAARPALADPRVRRALSAAIDRRRIVQAALAGYATPASGPVPPDHPLSESGERAPAHDPAQAAALLDAAGWRPGAGGIRTNGGQRLRLELATVGSGTNVAEQLIQADLASIGVDVSIRPMELGAFLAMARAPGKRFDMLFTGIPGDLSLSHLAAMFDGRQAGGALDYAGFSLPVLDSLFAAARVATPESAPGIWGRVLATLEREMPAAWIYHARGVQGLSRRLSGVRMDLRGELATVSDWTIGAPEHVAGRP